MAPVRNARLVFKQYVTDGYPVPGETLVYDESETIEPKTVPLNGGYLVKLLVLSIDPYLRRLMTQPDRHDRVLPAFEPGQTIMNNAIGIVLRSENPSVNAGQHILQMLPFQEYVVQHDPSMIQRVLDLSFDLPLGAFLGACGPTGQTAHHGWSEYAKPQKGDVVFVSSASGAVGSVVVQIAKAEGLKVIASAGSDEKVAYISSLGADVAFNYKTVNTRKVLQAEGPVNIYWDNVGGEALEAALDSAAHHARFIICGSMSSYNTREPYGVKSLQQLVWRQVHMYGFQMSQLAPKHAEAFYREFPARIARGEIKHKEHVVHGFENAAQAIAGVQMGANFGKCMVVVADE